MPTEESGGNFNQEFKVALLSAVDDLGRLNANRHFYMDFLTQQERATMANLWSRCLDRARTIEHELLRKERASDLDSE